MPFPPPPVDAIDTVLAYEDELREYARQQDVRLPEERVVVLDGARVHVHHGYGFVSLTLGRRYVNTVGDPLDADPPAVCLQGLFRHCQYRPQKPQAEAGWPEHISYRIEP